MPRIQSMSRLRFIAGRVLAQYDPWVSPQALKATEDYCRVLVEQSIVGCYLYLTGEGRYAYVNPKFSAIFGYEPGEIVERRIGVDDITWPEDRELVHENLRRRVTGEVNSVHYEYRGLRKDGTPINVEVHGSVTSYEGRTAIIGVLLDISDRLQAERAARENADRYALAALGSNDGLWDWDVRGNRVYYSERWKAQLGYSPEEISDRPEEWISRLHPDDVERARAAIAQHLDGRMPLLEVEVRVRHQDGRWRWMLVRGAAIRGPYGAVTHVAGSQTDITDRKQSEEKVAHDALHDTLTGLPNRSLFFDRLQQAMAFLQRRVDHRYAVLFLDIDRFKTVNESLGHPAGDQLIGRVAKRIVACVRPGDTVARLGGDEFGVLIEDFSDSEEPMRTAERIHEALAAPYDLDGTEVFANASIGIAMGFPGYSKPEDVMRDADAAMYRAKDLGRGRHAIFHPSMHADARAALQLETDLRRALDRGGELRLTYQPIVSLATGLVAGCEALVVWDHPTRGVIPPGDFIPAAEENGLVVPLGRWALLQGCTDCKAWNDALPRGASGVSVSVNLSGAQLRTTQVLEDVRNALAASGLSPRLLKLEVTESVVLQAGAGALLLNQLDALGVHLLLDDFGTGYSSLSYLHNFRFDTLKIDRSFISRLDLGGRHAELVRTIVSLARALSLDVVAEGVETSSQLLQVQMLHVEAAQGYWFSRALSAEDFRKLVLSRKPFTLPIAPTAISGARTRA
jgi:diguanylate cyclase (GGDEF)-like protein/PAS domain S-box-containing protein